MGDRQALVLAFHHFVQNLSSQHVLIQHTNRHTYTHLCMWTHTYTYTYTKHTIHRWKWKMRCESSLLIITPPNWICVLNYAHLYSDCMCWTIHSGKCSLHSICNFINHQPTNNDFDNNNNNINTRAPPNSTALLSYITYQSASVINLLSILCIHRFTKHVKYTVAFELSHEFFAEFFFRMLAKYTELICLSFIKRTVGQVSFCHHEITRIRNTKYQWKHFYTLITALFAKCKYLNTQIYSIERICVLSAF